MEAKERELQLFIDAGQKLDKGLIDEFQAQGHHLTGAWEESVHGTVLAIPNNTMLTGTMAKYGVYVNAGVAPDRVPFGGPPTGARPSKYITGLYNFWKIHGLSDKEAMSAAFATAKKQKIEGMPTVSSYAYSENGQRRWFILKTNQLMDNEINTFISDGFDAIVTDKFHETKSETI